MSFALHAVECEVMKMDETDARAMRVCADADGNACGSSCEAESALCDTLVPSDAARPGTRLEPAMRRPLSRRQTVWEAVTLAVTMTKRRRRAHTRKTRGARGPTGSSLRVAREKPASGCVDRRRSLE
eukprot:2578329-Pleurochrysis_carterae.AAC.1